MLVLKKFLECVFIVPFILLLKENDIYHNIKVSVIIYVYLKCKYVAQRCWSCVFICHIEGLQGPLSGSCQSLANIRPDSSLCPHHLGNSQNPTIRSTVQPQCLFYEVRTEEAGNSVCLCLMTLIVLSFFPQCTSFQPIRWQSKGHLVKAESV